MDAVQIKPLRALSEMHAAVELQKTYWGDDLESIVPAHMLFSLASHGGHVLAALDGERMIGVLIGFLGTHDEEPDRPAMANLQIVSKRMVVLPEYRGQGVGYRLKLAQRDLAIKQGVRLVTWTFDPLLATNAHLNIRKLGAISHRYVENYYGTTSDGGLASLGSSDRLLVEWWVTNRRVEERLHGNRGGLGLKQYLEANTSIANPTTLSHDALLLPAEKPTLPTTSMALLEIPLDYPALIRQNARLAETWRLHTRRLFNELMNYGYVVTDFIREAYEGRERAFYLLSYGNPKGMEPLDFSRN